VWQDPVRRPVPAVNASAGTPSLVVLPGFRASRSPNRAGPQLISMSLPAGSVLSFRLGSDHSSTAPGLTWNRHGRVLCTDGARAARA
jgi:hypothetical protein